MRIRTCPDVQIQCILYGKQQNPDCAVRTAIKRALLWFCVSTVTVTVVTHKAAKGQNMDDRLVAIIYHRFHDSFTHHNAVQDFD